MSAQPVPLADQNQAAVNDGANGQQQGGFGNFISFIRGTAIRMLIIYFVISFFKKGSNVNTPSQPGNYSTVPAANLFQNGTVFDMVVYLSESDKYVDFDDKDSLVWNKTRLVFGDWTSGPNEDGIHLKETKFVPSQHVLNNGSIYLHTFFAKRDVIRQSANVREALLRKDTVHVSKQLNKYMKSNIMKTKNLLTGQTDNKHIDAVKTDSYIPKPISHWHPNITINMIFDETAWMVGSVPHPISEHVEFLNEKTYKPVVYLNDFWNMKRDYTPINDTIKVLTLRMTYQPITLFKWQLFLGQTARNKMMPSFLTESDGEMDNDQDSLKEMLLETNPYLIGLTVVVSLLHSIFELLAFKNDIQFWNNRESLEGLSVRSVFFNVFQSVIVFLYVLDNDGNMMITISCFIGLLIELWKIKKVADFSIDTQNKILGIFPRIIMKDKGSYVESSTKQYDQLAFKYLSWLLFPLLAGYAIYSLFYQEHKGWYSWVLNMLYGFLLTFGFIMMTPQLFINYKLKSVAHLPWRMMTYKFLNTFIDDIFAFVIRMPMLYRIGCLRDDVVFFVFLYQRWIYKTDPTRVNEFGYSAEMEKQLAKPSSQQETIPESETKLPIEKKQD